MAGGKLAFGCGRSGIITCYLVEGDLIREIFEMRCDNHTSKVRNDPVVSYPTFQDIFSKNRRKFDEDQKILSYHHEVSLRIPHRNLTHLNSLILSHSSSTNHRILAL